MNRGYFFALVLLCGCGGRPAPDSQRVRGEWVVVDFHSPAQTEDRGQLRKHAIISEGTWSQQFQGEKYEDFEYALDPMPSPKHLDLTFTAPDGRKLTVRAIYELQRDEWGDRLRVCLGTPPVVLKDGKVEYVESTRPVAFEAKDGPLISYRRKTE